MCPVKHVGDCVYFPWFLSHSFFLNHKTALSFTSHSSRGNGSLVVEVMGHHGLHSSESEH